MSEEFVYVYGMGSEQSRDVLIRPSMSAERRESLGVPMQVARTMRGWTMRRDRLPDLRAICQHRGVGIKYVPERPRWDQEECRMGWRRIRRNVEAAMEDWTQFVLSEGWKAVGYRSLDDLCDNELFGIRFPAIEQRRTAVKQMTEAGLSRAEISTSLGQDRTTTWRDQKASGVRLGPPPRVANATRARLGTNVPNPPVIEGVVIEPDVEQWTAPRRDPATILAYQEGLTETPPPPDLRCVEETLRLLRTGEDLIPHEPLLDLYRASRNACSRVGLLAEVAMQEAGS